MSIEPLRFSGISTYSADFQKILERTVAIATQPITFLQNEQASLLQRKTLAGGLNMAVEGLGDALRNLTQTATNRAVAGTSSNTAKVTIGSVSASTPATYTISEITSLARSASATSAGYANSDSATVSATGSVRLSFAGTDYDLTLAAEENNLAGLRNKINGLGIGVTASILTTGTGSNPYYLSLTATTSGAKPIALVDDPAGAASNLLATVDNGANAEFKINGVAVSKSSNLVNDVVSGVTFTLVGTTTGSETVSVTLSSSRSALSDKLLGFVNAYNQVLDQTDAQIGEAAGLLTGSVLVRESGAALRVLSGYQGSGQIKSLSALGIEFGRDGKASFDPDAFAALDDAGLQNAFEFLGTSQTGFGALLSRVNQITDPVTGLIAVETAKYDESDKRIRNRVEELTTRLNDMQRRTAERLQSVDAILGSLESQQTLIEASYKSLNLVLFGKQDD